MNTAVSRKEYEKPGIKFVETRADQAVANTCWGGHGTDTTWYYDTKGTGYVSFQISGGSCTLNLSSLKYYEYKDEPGVPLSTSDPKYQEMYAALMKSGGDSGNPFKGENFDFPVRPDPSWS